MEIKQFIEKAIGGGWEGLKVAPLSVNTHLARRFGEKTAEKIWHKSILLDPLAWQAVGKVEGWGHTGPGNDGPNTIPSNGWKMNMHRMVDFLASGKTIEEFLATL